MRTRWSGKYRGVERVLYYCMQRKITSFFILGPSRSA